MPNDQTKLVSLVLCCCLVVSVEQNKSRFAITKVFSKSDEPKFVAESADDLLIMQIKLYFLINMSVIWSKV